MSTYQQVTYRQASTRDEMIELLSSQNVRFPFIVRRTEPNGQSADSHCASYPSALNLYKYTARYATSK